MEGAKVNLISLTDFFPNGRTIQFDVVSIVFIVILLIYLLMGIKNGLFSTILGMIKGIVSIVIAIILAKPIGDLLSQTFIGENISNSILNWLNNQGDIFQLIPSQSPLPLETLVNYGLSELNIAEFLRPILSSIILPMIDVNGSLTVGAYISLGITSYVLIVIGFIVVFILVRLLVALIRGLTKRINNIPVVGFVNRLAGGLLSLCFGILICSIISYGAGFVISIPGSFSESLSNMMYLNDPNSWSLSKVFFEFNLIGKILELIIV